MAVGRAAISAGGPKPLIRAATGTESQRNGLRQRAAPEGLRDCLLSATGVKDCHRGSESMGTCRMVLMILREAGGKRPSVPTSPGSPRTMTTARTRRSFSILRALAHASPSCAEDGWQIDTERPKFAQSFTHEASSLRTSLPVLPVAAFCCALGRGSSCRQRPAGRPEGEKRTGQHGASDWRSCTGRRGPRDSLYNALLLSPKRHARLAASIPQAK